MTSSGPHRQFSADRPVRRRRRPAVVCTECRRRKIACDRKLPCGQCTLHGADCVYGPTANGAGPAPRTAAAGGPRRASAATSPAGTSTRSANGASAQDSRTAQSSTRNGNILQPLPSPQDCEGDEYEDVDEEAASAHEIERMQDLMGTYYPRLSGRVCKTRLFGQSHWANNLVDQFRKVHHVNYQIFFLSDSSLHKQLRQCKVMSKALKARQLEAVDPGNSSDLQDFTATIPPRDVAERLVQTYLRTFEAVFRILHIPTFLDECRRYWEDPSRATEVFMTKFLIVLAIGSCTYDNEPGGLKENLRIAACRAIVKANAWQGAAISKHALTLDMIQVYCLVLLSRQTSAVEYGDDLVWISAGSLMHTAFTMGLHRDPGLFAGLTQYEIEMRRRLWATILEFVVQGSLDSGMPPLIGPDDFDCGPPSNINDEQISPDGGKSMLEPPLPDTVLTQTSCQRLLLRSLPLRLRIARFLNGLVTDQSYNEALRLSRELSSCCRTASALLESMGRNAGPGPDRRKPSAFQVQLVDILTRRFFHSLHAPWARKSLVHVQYYYSRRMHLDAALQMVAILTGDANLLGRIGQQGDEVAAVASPGPAQDDLDLMRIHGRGLFKCVLLDTCTTATFEAIQQLQEDPSLLGFDGSMTLSQKDLYKAVKSIVALSYKRIEEGETNFKAYCFYSCCLGQVDGMLAGKPVQEAILTAAKKALDESLEVLKDRMVKSGVDFPPPDPEEAPQESAKVQAQQSSNTGEADPEIDGGLGRGSSIMGDTAAYIMSGPPASGQHDLLTMPGITVDFRGNGLDDDQWMDFGLGPIDFDNTSESWILSGVGSEAPPSTGL